MSKGTEIKRRCVFCGGEGVTREHVWPQWLIELLAERYTDTSVTITWGKDRERTARELDATVKRVCAPCNTGWMAALEGRAKPILVPMIMGENLPITLVPLSQRILANWALKTALMLDFLHSGSKPVFQSSAYSSFFRDRHPTRHTAIWVACFGEPGLRFHASSQTIAMANPPEYTPEGIVTRGRAYESGALSTFSAQAAVFQVVTFPENSPTIRDALDPPGAIHIWPLAGRSFNWPVNNIAYGEAVLMAFSKRTVSVSF